MSALTRFEPLDDWLMEPFRDPFREMHRLMRANWPRQHTPAEMKLDVTENDKAYTVKAEVPGAKKEDLVVKIDGNLVSISAEVKEERETKGDGERALTREIYRGSMSRSFTLAHEINDKEANAKFENGILSLTLPKREPAKGTTLAIS
jgi:HSP20 family protein